MANKKITALDAVASLVGTEVFPVVQSSTTKKATIQNVLDLLGATVDSVALSVASEKATDATPALDATLRLTLSTGRYLVFGRLYVEFLATGGIQAFVRAGTATIANLRNASIQTDGDGLTYLVGQGGGFEDAVVVSSNPEESSGSTILALLDVTAAGTVGISWSQVNTDPSPSSIQPPSWLAAIRLGAAS